MTFEEARAEFPVLERIAYLNAGSAGPVPKAAVEAARAQLERDLAQGRSGSAFIEERFELRERVREGHAVRCLFSDSGRNRLGRLTSPKARRHAPASVDHTASCAI